MHSIATMYMLVRIIMLAYCEVEKREGYVIKQELIELVSCACAQFQT